MQVEDNLERISEDTLRVTIPPEKPIVYDIVIGKGLFPRIARDLAREKAASRYVIITDSNVDRLGYSQNLKAELTSQGLRVDLIKFPAGEKHKNTNVVNHIHEKLGEMSCNRDTMILALGGGVVGDLAGYVAGTYLRGIPFIDIPTTTLSQADSAIGGKKGVDLEAGKNLVGVFAQAKRVYMDLDTLNTLDEPNFRAGLVEGIKHGVIADREHFEFIDEYLDMILVRDYEALRIMTGRNCDIKGTVVQKDPKEKGLRRVLNYGHTLGHAVEKASNYRLLHGEAIAIGMNFAGQLANLVGNFPSADLIRQNNLLTHLGMKLTIPYEISNEELFAIMGVDKKAEAGQIRFCLPYEIGSMKDFGGKYTTPVDRSTVEIALDLCRKP